MLNSLRRHLCGEMSNPRKDLFCEMRFNQFCVWLLLFTNILQELWKCSFPYCRSKTIIFRLIRFLWYTRAIPTFFKFSTCVEYFAMGKTVIIQKFWISVCITITVSTILLSFSEYQAHTIEYRNLKSHLVQLSGLTSRSPYIGKEFLWQYYIYIASKTIK